MRGVLPKLVIVVATAVCYATVTIAAPNITRGPYLQSCSSTSVIVRWRTDVATDSRISFRAQSDQSDTPSADNLPVTEHQMLLTGLAADATYTYSIGTTTNVLAGGPGFSFRTAPTNTRPVRVWAIGDSGSGTTNQFTVLNSYLSFSNSENTDVWLMLGDNVYEAGTDDEYQTRMFDVYSDLFRRTPLWPAMGNHDMPTDPSRSAYFNIFTLPTNGECGGVPSHTELYYSFDWANIHFVCIDSWASDRSAGSTMLRWLRADLAATKQDWIIAYWHHPAYSMGTDFSDSMPLMIQMRENVVPILESYGVDLVLMGHSHVYERSYLLNGHYGPSWTFDWANMISTTLGREDGAGSYMKPAGGIGNNRGTVYVVCGCSGQGGVDQFAHHPAMAVTAGGYGSVVLDINGLRLDAKFLRPNGNIDDYFTIDKSQLMNITPRLAIRRSGRGATMWWPTSLPEFTLEAAPLPGFNWIQVTNEPSTIGRTKVVQVGESDANAVFRLRSGP